MQQLNQPIPDAEHVSLRLEHAKRRVVVGLSWQTFNTLVRQGISFGVGVILARLLSPGDFGLAGIAAMF